jgi:predicted aspartyl protease
MMQEDNHMLQIEYTENDYTAPQKNKGNKGYTIHKDSSGHI